MICLILMMVCILTKYLPQILVSFEPLNNALYYHPSFTVCGLNPWNSLPTNIQESAFVSSLKSALFKFIGAKSQFNFNLFLLVLRILMLLNCKNAFKF